MLVVMQHGATQAQIDRVAEMIEEMGYQARPMPGEQRTAVGLVGNDGRVDASRIEALDGVAEVIHVSKPYKQVSREWQPQNTVVTIAPGKAGIGTFSPPLDEAGNSVRGQRATAYLSRVLGLNIFASQAHTLGAQRKDHV